MARKKQEEEKPQGSPAWMTTYGDMVTLLLCFFVLLFAMSEVDVQKFEAVIRSFQGSLGVLDGGQILDEGNLQDRYLNDYWMDIYEVSTEDEELEEDPLESEFAELIERLEIYLEEEGLEASVLISEERRGLVLRFQDDVLFDPGMSELKPGAMQILDFFARLITDEEFEDKFLRVEGHTDNVDSRPMHETNWELSVERAVSAGRYLIEEHDINPERVSMAGYSEYHPIASNMTPEGRAQNRRVDIVVLSSRLEDGIDSNNDPLNTEEEEP